MKIDIQKYLMRKLRKEYDEWRQKIKDSFCYRSNVIPLSTKCPSCNAINGMSQMDDILLCTCGWLKAPSFETWLEEQDLT